MIALSQKPAIILSVISLIACITAGIVFDLPLLFAAPVAFAAAYYLLQHPVYLLYILTASLPWSIEYNFSPSLATDLPDEPLMILAALGALILLASKEENRKLLLHPLIIIVASGFLWILATVICSSSVVLSVKYMLAKGWYLLAFLVLPVALIQNAQQLRRLLAVLFFSSLLAACLALVRHGFYLYKFAYVNDALRPFFRNHVIYSALLVFMVPVNIVLLQTATRKLSKIFLVIALLILLAAIGLSFSRGAWLGLLAGLCAYWLIKKKLLLIAFLLMVFLSIGLVFWLRQDDRYLRYAHHYNTTIFHENFNEHITATYKLQDLSTAERFYRWIAGARMAADHWLTGTGPATFYEQYKSYTIPLFKTWVSRNEERSTVHNYFLLLLVEQGLLGLLLFLLLLAVALFYAERIYHRAGAKTWKIIVAAAASILVMEIVVNCLSDLVETDKLGSIFYLCIAILIIADRATGTQLKTFNPNSKTLN